MRLFVGSSKWADRLVLRRILTECFLNVATNPGVLAEGMLHVLLDEDGCKSRANIPQLQLEGS